MTIEQPADRAEESLRLGPPTGKFQGTNAATGPTGSRRTVRTVPGADGMIRP